MKNGFDLRITADGRRLTQASLVGLTGIRVQQVLSAPTQCELYFRSPPGPLETARKLAIGTKLEVQLTNCETSLFVGDVTAVEHEYGPENVQQIYVRGYDRLHRLRKRQQVRLFEKQTLGGLVREVAAEIGVQASVPLIKLNWDRLYQYQQDDLALITHLAAQYGYYLTLRENELHLITLEGMGQPHTLQLGDNLSQVRIEANANDAADEIMVTGWNTSRMEMHTDTVKNGRSGRQIRVKTGDMRFDGRRRHYLVNENAPNQAQATALAQAELDYRTATEVTLQGETDGDPKLQPGARVRVRGVERPLAGDYVLTEVTHDLQAGDYTTHISTEPPSLPERTHSDVATFGEVSQINDPANAGRVRVTLPTYNDIETDWMNVVMPGAGPRKGFIMLPDKGDKVLVILTQGNPGQGIVVGGLFGANRLPDDGVSLGSSVTSQSWFSPGGQRIQLDDQGNKIRLENDSGAYIEMAGGRITIVGNRIDFRRINIAKQLLNEASDLIASEETIRAELTEWLQRQSERNGRVVVILIIFAVITFLVFIGYVLFQSFFTGG
ncbi:MAG: contractile injection system protein, VgrG/Pvc8 family [Chloroflexota bacterium]